MGSRQTTTTDGGDGRSTAGVQPHHPAYVARAPAEEGCSVGRVAVEVVGGDDHQ
jgi:hypothetical protein